MFVIHIIAYTYFGSIFTQNGKIETSLQLHSIARQAHDMKFVTSCFDECWLFLFGKKNKIVFDAAILSSILYGCESWFGVNLDSMASGINIYSFFSDIQNNYSRYPKKNLWYLKMYFGYPKYCHINFWYLKKNSGYPK